MSSEATLIIEVTPQGNGLALDLAGGRGILRKPLEKLGYRYINLDIKSLGNGQPSVVGNAQTLPFGDACFDLVVCKDALQNFLQPWTAIKEVFRILKPGGLFIIHVGFMCPFADDAYRFTPVGLRYLLSDFDIISFESPLSVFTVLSTMAIEVLKRLHLGFGARPIRRFCYWLDRRLARLFKHPSSFAAGYRLVCRKHVEVTP